jgi:hypothetical protein
VKIDYRGFELNANRERSLGGDHLLYYFIIRKVDGWMLEDSFTTGSETPAEYMLYLKAQVDDYYANPLDRVSVDDRFVVESVIEELLPTFSPEQVGAIFTTFAREVSDGK